MEYRWILFDADGTLFDYELAETAALQALWTELGLGSRTDLDVAYRRINAELWRRFEAGEVTPGEIKLERFRRLADELSLEAAPADLSRAYIEHLGRQTQLLPGAERLLESLSPRYRLALITNGLAAVQRSRLALSTIGRHFPVVVISEEVGWAKPDPRIFARALELMESPQRREVLMVGDNLLADIEGAHRFGFETCWFNQDGRATNGHVTTTHEVHRLSELRERLA